MKDIIAHSLDFLREFWNNKNMSSDFLKLTSPHIIYSATTVGKKTGHEEFINVRELYDSVLPEMRVQNINIESFNNV